MCGIIAYMGPKNATSVALDGLKRLEYRGYDSWGIAWLDGHAIKLERKIGRIGEAKSLPSSESHLAVAHTRWATHGGVEEKNAHPHLSNDQTIAIVHNGIIENYSSIKEMLKGSSYKFSSDTDTEVIPNLLQHTISDSSGTKQAGESKASTSSITKFRDSFEQTLSRLEGTYAIVALNSKVGLLAFARKGSPLCIGLGKSEIFVASDVSAFIAHTKDVVYLEDNEYGFIEQKGDSFALTIKKLGTPGELRRKPVRLSWDAEDAEKDGYAHFMLKEIMEQPRIITETLAGRIIEGRVILDSLNLDGLAIPTAYLKALRKVVIISCGTAYHASLISKYVMENILHIDIEADYASEFRYRHNTIDKGVLHIFISQSGETADTLAAMRRSKAAGAKTLSIVNVMGSTLARESDYVLYTRAGPEIGVASTKAFTSQLVTMALLAVYLGAESKMLPDDIGAALLKSLSGLSKKAEETIKSNIDAIQQCAKLYSKSKSLLYIGRNLNYPLALEGALKLKEISYLHAEGFPAGELKHGPIALIEPDVPTICIATDAETYPKMLSNIQEIKARKGPIIAIATEGNTELLHLADHVLYIPKVGELLSPILSAIPLQLLAYYIASERGCDIDKPRNLAKSVTVE